MRRPASLGLLAVALVACSRPPAADPAYVSGIEKARAERLKSLTGENGWLTVVGLSWLKPGENSFGSDPAADVVLKGAGIPPRVGVFDVRPDGTVAFRLDLASGTAKEPTAPVAVNGTPSLGGPLATDLAGKPDRLTVGGLRLTVLQRADRFAIRVKDPENPARKAFKGIEYFPIDPRLDVEGTFERYATPREVEVPSAQGPAQKMQAPGLVRFTIAGKGLALEPFVEGPDDDTFMFVFRDATAGKETYGAGRFLYAAVPKDGKTKVDLDFNRAINPPCAFTAYATCPLPTPGNVLALRIEAGEKVPAGH